MDNVSRRYYERELGAGIGPSPTLKEHFGYTEPLRRFVQREDFSPQANEIANTMPSWLPGDDYLTNFRVGDPYVKVDQGFARLPGAGYEAIHPELKGVNPKDYPDINKLAILADVAPYSREYNIFRQKVGEQAQDNTELRIEYEKILERVRQTKESVIRMEDQVSPSCLTQKTPRAGARELAPVYARAKAKMLSVIDDVYADSRSSCVASSLPAQIVYAPDYSTAALTVLFILPHTKTPRVGEREPTLRCTRAEEQSCLLLRVLLSVMGAGSVLLRQRFVPDSVAEQQHHESLLPAGISEISLP